MRPTSERIEIFTAHPSMEAQQSQLSSDELEPSQVLVRIRRSPRAEKKACSRWNFTAYVSACQISCCQSRFMCSKVFVLCYPISAKRCAAAVCGSRSETSKCSDSCDGQGLKQPGARCHLRRSLQLGDEANVERQTSPVHGCVPRTLLLLIPAEP